MGHYLLLVTTEIQEGFSHHARERVYETLMADSAFSTGGISRAVLTYEPVCDYFTIGGAWSGYLIGQEKPSDNEHGEDYDAQVLSQEQYLQFLSPYRGKALFHSNHLEFFDMEGEDCTSLYIGRKWLVVLDLHI